MRKRILFTAVLLLAAAVLFTGCKKKEEITSLRVGYAGSLCEAPLHIAYEKGFFKEEGLEVELVRMAPGTGFDVFAAGQVDASFALLASMPLPLSNGLAAKITTGLHTGCDIVLVKADSGITKPQDLIGKTMGVPSMVSSPIIHAKRVLADNGVDIRIESSQVDFVVYSTADLPLVLSNGSVDAIAMNEPTASIAVNEYGFKILFDSAVDKPYNEQYCCVAYISDKIIENHKDLAVKYTRAMQKASAYVNSHQDEITRLQIDLNYVAGDALVNAEVLKKFNYIPSVSKAYDMFGVLAPHLQRVGMLSEDVDIVALQKNSFVFLEGLDDEYK
jgi:NitT/TauT family transport system substrate-binding protein